MEGGSDILSNTPPILLYRSVVCWAFQMQIFFSCVFPYCEKVHFGVIETSFAELILYMTPLPPLTHCLWYLSLYFCVQQDSVTLTKPCEKPSEPAWCSNGSFCKIFWWAENKSALSTLFISAHYYKSLISSYISNFSSPYWLSLKEIAGCSAIMLYFHTSQVQFTLEMFLFFPSDELKKQTRGLDTHFLLK